MLQRGASLGIKRIERIETQIRRLNDRISELVIKPVSEGKGQNALKRSFVSNKKNRKNRNTYKET